MGYTKLFTELVASSIWDEDDKTRVLWITMLALKDRAHFVRGTIKYLALSARLGDADCQESLNKLMSPDPNSRSTEHEGRRVKAVPGGWEILNGERYSKMLSYEERKQYNREKQAEYRKRKKLPGELGKQAGAQRAIKEGFTL